MVGFTADAFLAVGVGEIAELGCQNDLIAAPRDGFAQQRFVFAVVLLWFCHQDTEN